MPEQAHPSNHTFRQTNAGLRLLDWKAMATEAVLQKGTPGTISSCFPRPVIWRILAHLGIQYL